MVGLGTDCVGPWHPSTGCAVGCILLSRIEVHFYLVWGPCRGRFLPFRQPAKKVDLHPCTERNSDRLS